MTKKLEELIYHSCTRKQKHSTLGQALLAITATNKQALYYETPKKLSPYECHFCGFYHIGHQPKNKTFATCNHYLDPDSTVNQVYRNLSRSYGKKVRLERCKSCLHLVCLNLKGSVLKISNKGLMMKTKDIKVDD